jgi:hypothetical protein
VQTSTVLEVVTVYEDIPKDITQTVTVTATLTVPVPHPTVILRSDLIRIGRAWEEMAGG